MDLATNETSYVTDGYNTIWADDCNGIIAGRMNGEFYTIFLKDLASGEDQVLFETTFGDHKQALMRRVSFQISNNGNFFAVVEYDSGIIFESESNEIIHQFNFLKDGIESNMYEIERTGSFRIETWMRNDQFVILNQDVIVATSLQTVAYNPWEDCYSRTLSGFIPEAVIDYSFTIEWSEEFQSLMIAGQKDEQTSPDYHQGRSVPGQLAVFR